jgi:hypothetical protein
MHQKKITTSESPRVEVTACQGDLAVKAWDDVEVLVEVESEEVLTVEEREGTVALAANGDCGLTVPVDASLIVVQAKGDLSVRGVRGSVEATTVRGDAEVRQVNGPVEFGTVGGDLAVEETEGGLSARSVAGDAYLRQLDGMLYLSDVGGDLVGRAWTAGADVAQVGGDVSLKTIFAGPYTYDLRARGNVVVKSLPDSNAAFTLQAAQGHIRAKGLCGEMAEQGEWQAVIGDGEAEVTLVSTHGNVLFKAVGEREEDQEPTFFFAADFGKIGAEAGLAAQELAGRIQQHVADKLAKIDFEAIAHREAEKARRHAEREAARAQRMAKKARRKAERAQRKAQKKMMWRFEWDAGRGRRRTTGRGQAVSDEERLAVLKMLSEGKISTQEAETLLQALEG